MRWSARITACLVRAGPIRCSMRGTLCQLMFMPSPISGTRIWASRAMTRKSSATASATPPPMQKPSMAPMVICSISCQARVSRGPSFRCRRSAPISMVRRARPSGSFRSKPAVNALAPPGQHHDRGFAVILEAARGIGELAQRFRRQRIDAVAAVEAHHGDAAVRPKALFDRYKAHSPRRLLIRFFLVGLIVTNAGSRVQACLQSPRTGSRCRP